MIFYYAFVERYPCFYDSSLSKAVVYLPHFFIVFSIFTFLPQNISFIIFGLASLYGWYFTMKFFRNRTYILLICTFLILTTFTKSLYSNLEGLVFGLNVYFVHVFAREYEKNRKLNIWCFLVIFFLCFFGFKIYSLIFLVFPILIAQKTKEKVTIAIIAALFIGCLNFPFTFTCKNVILLYLEALQNPPAHMVRNIWWTIGTIINRPALSFPLCLLALTVSKYFFNKKDFLMGSYLLKIFLKDSQKINLNQKKQKQKQKQKKLND